MKLTTKSVIAVAVFLCTCTAVWAQLTPGDNRLFTLPPTTAAGQQIPATGTPNATALLVEPVILNFDGLPGSEWYVNDCLLSGSGTVSHGILTINSPFCYEYILYDPLGVWNKFVSNSRGWIVEASLKVDPLTEPACLYFDRLGTGWGSAQIWASDHTNTVIIGFSTNEVCIAAPEEVHFTMNTTDRFHVYRIETKGMHTRIYVDGTLAIDHVFTHHGLGTQALVFGDGNGSGTSLTKWDYFSYNVFPVNLAP